MQAKEAKIRTEIGIELFGRCDMFLKTYSWIICYYVFRRTSVSANDGKCMASYVCYMGEYRWILEAV